MRPIPMDEVASRLSGRLLSGDGNTRIRGVAIDSREVEADQLFFALGGTRSHGVEHIPGAFAAGAGGAVVERSVARDHLARLRSHGPVIAVDDPVRALARLAERHRQETKSEMPAAAITGSVGKTTTVRYLASLLADHGVVHRPPASYNNHLGVPITLLNAPDACDFLVAEVGSNAVGEVHRLASWVAPRIVAVTAVAPVHLKGFGSLEAIELEKLSILDAVEPGGVGWIPHALAAKYDALLRSLEVEVRTFGEGGELQILSDRIMGSQHVVRQRGRSRDIEFEWEAPFPHSPRNLEAVLAIGTSFGVEIEDLLAAIRSLEPLALRGEVQRHAGVDFMLDCYNASPVALESAIERLENSEVAGRRHCVIGTMEELGDQEQVWHRRLGHRLASEKLDSVFLIGRGQEWYQGGLAQGGSHGEALEVSDDSAVRLAEQLEPGDCVLFKASRSEALERFADRVGALLDRRKEPV